MKLHIYQFLSLVVFVRYLSRSKIADREHEISDHRFPDSQARHRSTEGEPDAPSKLVPQGPSGQVALSYSTAVATAFAPALAPIPKGLSPEEEEGEHAVLLKRAYTLSKNTRAITQICFICRVPGYAYPDRSSPAIWGRGGVEQALQIQASCSDDGSLDMDVVSDEPSGVGVPHIRSMATPDNLDKLNCTKFTGPCCLTQSILWTRVGLMKEGHCLA